jgi:hypothetical protein
MVSVRNTPTCVGKTAGARAPRKIRRKHPHVCGEDYEEPPASEVDQETPPRVWGRRKARSVLSSALRNTSTCVGKTIRSPLQLSSREKHPHVCGEDGNNVSNRGAVKETPPRVWGRLDELYLDINRAGNTPTCVGKTCGHAESSSSTWKHPHVCGEDYYGRPQGRSATETPPRVWGRRRVRAVRSCNHGNTPTCVGKTKVDVRPWQPLRKHPHVCGEDSLIVQAPEPSAETPPRVWGRPFITPAIKTTKPSHSELWGG